MTLRRPALVLAVAVAGIAVGVPAAEAGSGDVQAIRTAVANYKVATLNGSAKACQMLSPIGQQVFVALASMDLGTERTGCPEAVKALAKLNAAKFPNRQAYLRSGEAVTKAIARSKVKVHGSGAKLDYAFLDASGTRSSSIDLVLVHGRWLIDGWSDTFVQS